MLGHFLLRFVDSSACAAYEVRGALHCTSRAWFITIHLRLLLYGLIVLVSKDRTVYSTVYPDRLQYFPLQHYGF